MMEEQDDHANPRIGRKQMSRARRFTKAKEVRRGGGVFDYEPVLSAGEMYEIALDALSALTAGKPEQVPSDEHRYAERLLIALMEKHYPDRSPEWAPLPDLMGILTQIDNLTTGLVRAAPTAGGGDA
ncbi:MAG TPA: hypothetical protein VF226_02850 [Hyphomicrobiaceae bacterium]